MCWLRARHRTNVACPNLRLHPHGTFGHGNFSGRTEKPDWTPLRELVRHNPRSAAGHKQFNGIDRPAAGVEYPIGLRRRLRTDGLKEPDLSQSEGYAQSMSEGCRSDSSLALGATFVAVLLCALSCGDDNTPATGYSDPCVTPFGPILACEAKTVAVNTFGAREACDKLVACGVIAGEFVSNNVHRLDFSWCVERLLEPPSSPCDGNRRFSSGEVDAAIACIKTTPCPALGLPLPQKRSSGQSRGELDRYTCANGNATQTATVCDHGILRY